jgi:hypothetical protein
VSGRGAAHNTAPILKGQRRQSTNALGPNIRVQRCLGSLLVVIHKVAVGHVHHRLGVAMPAIHHHQQQQHQHQHQHHQQQQQQHVNGATQAHQRPLTNIHGHASEKGKQMHNRLSDTMVYASDNAPRVPPTVTAYHHGRATGIEQEGRTCAKQQSGGGHHGRGCAHVHTHTCMTGG